MPEYSCEAWIVRKCTFKVPAESVDEAIERAERIAAGRADKGEEVVKCRVRRADDGRDK
jgi:hypothetical protein